jgi:hypothetical protein
VGVRLGPPVPKLSLSEDFVMSTANAFRIKLNKALVIARDISLGKDFKLFLLVSCPHRSIDRESVMPYMLVV